MRFFRRVVELIVGGDEGGTWINGNLNIDFHVTKNIEMETPDEAVITINNLSGKTKRAITGEYHTVSLRAGYEGAISLMFTGDIKTVKQYKNGTDWALTINCGDGYKALSTAVTNRTYASRTQIKDIISDVAKDMNLGLVLDGEIDKLLPRGKVVSGESRTALSQLATAHHFDWSVQDGQLVVTQHKRSRETVYDLTFESGLIESPELVEEGTDNRQVKQRTGRKYRMKSFMLPSLRPKDRIVVLDNIYRITETQNIGNSLSGEFVSIIEGVHLGAAR